MAPPLTPAPGWVHGALNVGRCRGGQQTAGGLAVRWGFAPSRLAGMNREGCFADTVGAPEHGGGHPGGWEPGALGTGSASADGRLGPGDAPVATQVRPGQGSAGLRSQSEPLPVRPVEAPPRVAVPLSHAASSRCGRLAPSHLLRARLAWHIEEQLEVTPPSPLTGARAPAGRSASRSVLAGFGGVICTSSFVVLSP